MNEAEVLARLDALEAAVKALVERLDRAPTLEEQHATWVAKLRAEGKE